MTAISLAEQMEAKDVVKLLQCRQVRDLERLAACAILNSVQ